MNSILFCFLFLALILPLDSLRIENSNNGVWINGKKVAGRGNHRVEVKGGSAYVNGRRVPNLKVDSGGSVSASISNYLSVNSPKMESENPKQRLGELGDKLKENLQKTRF